MKAVGAENVFFSKWTGYQANAIASKVQQQYIKEQLDMIPDLLTQLADIAALSTGFWLIVKGAFAPGALLALLCAWRLDSRQDSPWLSGYFVSWRSPCLLSIPEASEIQDGFLQGFRI